MMVVLFVPVVCHASSVSSDFIRRQVPYSRYVLPFSCRFVSPSMVGLMIGLSILTCAVRLLLDTSTVKVLYVPAGTVISWMPENLRVSCPVIPRLELPVFTGSCHMSPTLVCVLGLCCVFFAAFRL